MAITVNSTSSSGNQNNASSFSWGHTTHADDTFLIVIVSTFDTTNADRPVTGVTFNTTENFTDPTFTHFYDDGVEHRTEVWYLPNPSTSTTANIEVTLTGACTDVCAGAIGASGIDTGSPEDTSTTANGSTGDPTVSLGGAAANSLLVAGLIIAENAGGTLTCDQHQIHITDMGNDHGGASYEHQADGTTLSWTYTEDDQNWGMICCSFAASSGEVDRNVSESESITVSDTPTLAGPSAAVGETETVSVAETVGRQLVSFIAESEAVTVADSATVAPPDVPAAVSDSVTVGETVTLTLSTLVLSVTETITVTDTDSVAREGEQPARTISVSESITVGDSPAEDASDPEASATDTVTVADAPRYYEDLIAVLDTVNANLRSFISASESVSVADSATLAPPGMASSASESVTVTETIKLQVVSFIAVSESISVAETIARQLVSFIGASESVSVAETIARQLVSFISASESISLADAPGSLGGDLPAAISDSITVTDSPTIYKEGDANPSVSDSITVSETVWLAVLTAFHIDVYLSDAPANSLRVGDAATNNLTIADALVGRIRTANVSRS